MPLPCHRSHPPSENHTSGRTTSKGADQHGEAAIEALAGSIAAKGMLQNLVVEPEVDADGEATGTPPNRFGEIESRS